MAWTLEASNNFHIYYLLFKDFKILEQGLATFWPLGPTFDSVS